MSATALMLYFVRNESANMPAVHITQNSVETMKYCGDHGNWLTTGTTWRHGFTPNAAKFEWQLSFTQSKFSEKLMKILHYRVENANPGREGFHFIANV